MSLKPTFPALQMSEGASVLRDGAQAAVGCDAAAEELVTGAPSSGQAFGFACRRFHALRKNSLLSKILKGMLHSTSGVAAHQTVHANDP